MEPQTTECWPNEIFITIFEYLDPEYRICVISRVCKLWGARVRISDAQLNRLTGIRALSWKRDADLMDRKDREEFLTEKYQSLVQWCATHQHFSKLCDQKLWLNPGVSLTTPWSNFTPLIKKQSSLRQYFPPGLLDQHGNCARAGDTCVDQNGLFALLEWLEIEYRIYTISLFALGAQKCKSARIKGGFPVTQLPGEFGRCHAGGPDEQEWSRRLEHILFLLDSWFIIDENQTVVSPSSGCDRSAQNMPPQGEQTKASCYTPAAAVGDRALSLYHQVTVSLLVWYHNFRWGHGKVCRCSLRDFLGLRERCALRIRSKTMQSVYPLVRRRIKIHADPDTSFEPCFACNYSRCLNVNK